MSRVRVTQLPEMRIAYLEQENSDSVAVELWEEFNTWRLRTRPSLGRVDIAAIGWWMLDDEGVNPIALRTGVPVRSDYAAPAPAHTTFFPGGSFAYAYADDADEIDAAIADVAEFLDEAGIHAISGPIELYKFHYNLDQHPADCGFLLEPGETGQRPAGPLLMAR